MASSDPQPGTLIADRYRLVTTISTGGHGCVWAAKDERLQRAVAVKLLLEDTLAGETGRVRFEREAMAAARLRSPNIVQIYDYGVVDGAPFMVMELLDGESLLDRLLARGKLPLTEVVDLVFQIAKALQTAHEGNVVHRDLKPGNVFLVRDQGHDLVKVLDFGLAKARLDLDACRETTAEGQVLGTPRYMSPEQAHGARSVDHNTDLWSLGVIAYRALTGELPFDGDGLGELIGRICLKQHLPPSEHAPELPVAIDDFFARALAKKPEHRFESARALANALLRIAEPDAAASGRWAAQPPPPDPSSPALHAPLAEETLPTVGPPPVVAERRTDPVPPPDHDGETSVQAATSTLVPELRTPKRWPRALAAGLVAAAGTLGIGWGMAREQAVPELARASLAAPIAALATRAAPRSAFPQRADDPRAVDASATARPAAPASQAAPRASAARVPPPRVAVAPSAQPAASRPKAPSKGAGVGVGLDLFDGRK